MIQPAEPDPANPPPARRSNSPRVGARRALRPMSLCLCDFHAEFATAIASWVRSDRELTWLAPRTLPPLTAAKVIAWGRDRANRILLWDAAAASPVGYSELNLMPNEKDHYWIGHFIVAPHLRGRGLGVRFVQAILDRAFHDLAASETSLVVFPDNTPAIRSYEHCGMKATGREIKYFRESRERHELIRMAIKRSDYDQRLRDGRTPERSILYIEDSALLRRGPVRLPYD